MRHDVHEQYHGHNTRATGVTPSRTRKDRTSQHHRSTRNHGSIPTTATTPYTEIYAVIITIRCSDRHSDGLPTHLDEALACVPRILLHFLLCNRQRAPLRRQSLTAGNDLTLPHTNRQNKLSYRSEGPA